MVYDWQREMLGEYANHGYYIREYEDAYVLCFKGREFAAYSKLATAETLQEGCRRYEARLRQTVGVSS